MPVLPPQRRHALLIAHGFRIGKLSLYFGGALEGVRKTIAETQLSVLGAGACLPYF